VNPTDATRILPASKDGEQCAAAKLIPIVYDELRRRAQDYLNRERPDHTLEATALVHEVYVRLSASPKLNCTSRAHFSAIAARLMRQILVQHARARHAQKRGGAWQKLSLAEAGTLGDGRAPTLLALDDALLSLAAEYPRQSEVVELKFFGGLTANDIAAVLGVSEKTVLRDWNFARVWLARELQNADAA